MSVTDPRVLDPSLYTVPRRELGDTRGTVRFTDFSGGYDVEKAETYFGDPYTGPGYWDSQNINTIDRPGKAFLSKQWTRIGAAEADDHEYLLLPFNVAVYRFPTANHSAALVQKVTSATGVIAAWTALSNIYPGATAVRNAVVWRGSVYVASRENLLRIMSSAEVWSTLAAPPAVGAALVGQIGIGPDDTLAVWWESQGLYTYDGTTWVKIYPGTASVVPSDAYCDLIFMGPGSLQFVTRDTTGNATWREHSVEPTGTFRAAWFTEPAFQVWPQGGASFQGKSYLVGRLGAHRNVGILYDKAKLLSPDPVASLDTNLATVSQRGLDWSWRCFFASGDIAYIGGSSRQDRNACLYHFEVDSDGELINPLAVISGVGGPIYSIALLPYAATGAASNERIFISVGKATYYKDGEDDAAPTTDAATGFLQLPDIDLGLEDHRRQWADMAAYLTDLSVDGYIQVQYRVDPGDPSDSWTILSDATHAAGKLTDIDGFTHIYAPNDDATVRPAQIGTLVRILQVRLVWTRPTSGTTRDVLDTISIRFSALLSLGGSGL